jgi:GMP synthase-like glutamine amidotransferase
MSANDEAELGWLRPEIALVREAIAADKTVLGICLGAQIIAKALGARVYPGSGKEIGWFPVQREAGSHPFFDGLPDSFTPLHWHGETIDLPHGARLLAKSKITETQASAVGQRVLGLQFHMEATEESVRALPEGCCPRNRSWRFRAAARHDPRQPRPMREPSPLARYRARPVDRICGQRQIRDAT